MIIFWDADDAAELKFKALKILQHPFLTGSFIIADHNPASAAQVSPGHQRQHSQPLCAGK